MCAARVAYPEQFVPLNVLAIVLFVWLLKLCADVCVTAALAAGPFASLATRAIRIFTLLLILTYLYIDLLARQIVTLRQLLFGVIVGVVLIASLLVLGGLVRLLRRRYEQWLTLDIAG